MYDARFNVREELSPSLSLSHPIQWPLQSTFSRQVLIIMYVVTFKGLQEAMIYGKTSVFVIFRRDT